MAPSVIATDPRIVRKNGRRINAAGLTFQSDSATFQANSLPSEGDAADSGDVNEPLRREIARHAGDLLVRDAVRRAESARRTVGADEAGGR